jgi:hypothetical protein
MSYTPEGQFLKSGLNQIIGGINELTRAINVRVEDSERWSDSHLSRIVDLKNRLAILQLELIHLRTETK